MSAGCSSRHLNFASPLVNIVFGSYVGAGELPSYARQRASLRSMSFSEKERSFLLGENMINMAFKIVFFLALAYIQITKCFFLCCMGCEYGYYFVFVHAK